MRFFCEARVCVWDLSHSHTFRCFRDVGRFRAAGGTDTEGAAGAFSMLSAAAVVMGHDGQGWHLSGFPAARFAYTDFTVFSLCVLGDGFPPVGG